MEGVFYRSNSLTNGGANEVDSRVGEISSNVLHQLAEVGDIEFVGV